MKDISPVIPVVTWDWVAKGRGRTGLTELENAAFVSHMVETSPAKGQVRSKIGNDSSGDISRISSVVPCSPGVSPLTPKIFSEFTHDDPSDSFYSSLRREPQPLPRNPNANDFETQANPPLPLKSDQQGEAYDPLAEFYVLAKAERDNGVRSGLLFSHSYIYQQHRDNFHSARRMNAMLLL